MSEREEPAHSPVDRLVSWMAAAAIAVTIVSILFPGLPASLSIAVDTALLVLMAAVANEAARDRQMAASTSPSPDPCASEPAAAEGTRQDDGACPPSDLHFPSRGAILGPVRASSSDG